MNPRLRRILVVTGSRAEYGLLRNLLRLILESSQHELLILVTGTHLSPRHGYTIEEIESDGFQIADYVSLDFEQNLGIAELTAQALIGFAKSFEKLHPDAVILLGDRYEVFAAAVAAHFARIPIAHLHGGETTEGAIDDALRHSITQMASWHFTAAEPYLQRILAMGANPMLCHCVGPLILDALQEPLTLTREEFEASTGFEFGSFNILLTYHPETLAADLGKLGLVALLEALETIFQQHPSPPHLLFTHPNADEGGNEIASLIQSFCEKYSSQCWFVPSLGQQRYIAALHWFDALVGNSSSGVIEAPLIGTKVLNIGDRQRGRMRFGQVYDVAPVETDIGRVLNDFLAEKSSNEPTLSKWDYPSPSKQIFRILLLET
ncbi:UDP-N-acetylglucosamine 2-epimerase [Synechococcus sp. CCY 9618]|uniref:UDP-N-acetylglucosamine 2-epimerase n=1 Tax=Synechococcus sp. CCY 9618 TaxID=2815602 RepID=UPI001C24D84D|nr:UDP-N-acetylglucosamine 2-epimerase [Synechococcus sp. CCY 9618]